MHRPTLPQEWNPDFSYLFGLLLGDGSLPNCITKSGNYKPQKRHLVHFYSNSKIFVEEVYLPLFKKLFNIEPRNTILKREGRSDLFVITIESKILYTFLKMKGFTIGKKACIAKVPKIPESLEVFLLAGLLDTDGGKKGGGFGLSTASESLALFCIKVFKDNQIPYKSTPCPYNGHVYHQIWVRRTEMYRILRCIPLQHPDKIEFLKHAPVA